MSSIPVRSTESSTRNKWGRLKRAVALLSTTLLAGGLLAVGIAPAQAASPTSTDLRIAVRVDAQPLGNSGSVGTDYTDTVGATFRLAAFTTLAAGPGALLSLTTNPWAQCVVTAGGACTIEVPNTNAGGANNGQRFWVVQTAGAPGTFFSAANDPLLLGNVSGPVNPRYIVGATQALVPNTTQNMPLTTSTVGGTYPTTPNGTYAVDANFGSFGAVVNSRENPTIIPTCEEDVRVALQLDLSPSISGADLATYRTALKTVAAMLTDAGAGVAIFTFNDDSPALISGNTAGGARRTNYPVPTTNLATIESRIDELTSTGGATNWDRAMRVVSTENATQHYDYLIFVTDGAPNYIASGTGAAPARSEPNGSDVTLRSLEGAIYSANAIKKQGTKIFAVGVGAGVTGATSNLIAISGPTANVDYYQSTWALLIAELQKVAQGITCQVPIMVEKYILNDQGQEVLQSGWPMTLAHSPIPNGGTVSPAGLTQNTTGTPANALWTVEFNDPDDTATVTVTEQTPRTISGTQYAFQSGEYRLVRDGVTTTIPFGSATTPQIALQVGDRLTVKYVNAPDPARWTLEKTSNPASGSTVVPGQTITYTVTAHNPSSSTLPSQTVTDDLTTVLNNATFVNGSISTTPAATATRTGNTLTWTVPALAPGATATVSYQVTVNPEAWGVTLRNVVTPSGSVPPEPCPDDRPLCRETTHNTPTAPQLVIDKSDGTAMQLADGTWQVDYVVTVTNPTAYATQYTLTDTPDPGAGWEVVSQGWVGGAPAVPQSIAAATGDPLVPVVHTYTYRVIFDIDDEFVGELSLVCTTGGATGGGGAFHNRASITFPGGTDSDDGCAEPAAPTVTKTEGAAVFNAVSGEWELSYTITVTNSSGMQLAYELSDTPQAFPSGVNPATSWAVSAPASLNGGTFTAAGSTWNGDPNTLVGTGTLPAGASHVFTVTAGVTLTGSASAPALLCSDTPGGSGFWNTATVTNGVGESSDSDCAEIVPPTVRVVKDDGTATQLADGTWQITYNIHVTNLHSTIPTTFTLTDEPDFDVSFDVLTQGWSGTAPVPDNPIAAGATLDFTYVVTAESNVDPVPSSGLTCETGANGGGGFYNVASIVFPGGEDSDDGCAEPATPRVTKTAAASVQDAVTGNWTISYQIQVHNDSGMDLAYVLTDTAAAPPSGATPVGDWIVTGPVTGGAGSGSADDAWNGTGRLATGHFPDGATHTYTVSRVMSIATTTVPASLICGDTPGGNGFWNTATVTNGVGGNDDSDCASIVNPHVFVGKDVTSVSQTTDGTWVIVYEVRATNGSSELTAKYDLSDELKFGGGVTILGGVDAPTWTGPSGSSGTFTGNSATLATGLLLSPAGIHTYTVTVRATIDGDGWAGQTLVCDPGATPGAGGFLNTVTLTANGTVRTADDCAEPELPTIEKTAVSALQDPSDPDQWLVSYDITVTGSGFDTYYTLRDIPGFAVGITLGAGTAQRTDIGAQPVLPITTGSAFPAVPVALGADDEHTWTVSWIATIPGVVAPEVSVCGAAPAAGDAFYNAIDLLQGGIKIDDDDACIPVEHRVYPDIEKTVTSVAQRGDYGWTIVYQIEVTLTDDDELNPEGLAAPYNLSDTLEFGGDIVIRGGADAPTWTGPGDTGGTFAGDSAVMATNQTILAGATHIYTVTVIADVPAEAIGESTACLGGASPDAGGFLNVATLVSGDQTTDASDCAEPVFPDVEKTGSAATQIDEETWEIEYQIEVSYPDTDQSPEPTPVYFSLTDTPALPSGVTLVGDWAAAASTGAPLTNTTFDGDGTWTLVTDGILVPDAVFIYTISATVKVTAAPAGQPQECADVDDSGILLLNGATITSGDYTASDDACTVVHWDDVGIEKTSELPDDQTSVAPGDEFDYVLTVTNHGTRPATNVVVTDQLHERLEVVSVTLPSAQPAAWSDDSVGNALEFSTATLAVGAEVDIVVRVKFLPAATPAAELSGDGSAPDFADPLEELPNQACVDADHDRVSENNCDEEDIPTRDFTAVVFMVCVNDAPLLGWEVKKSTLLVDEEITMVWTPDTGGPSTDPEKVEHTAEGGTATWAGVILWPGIAYSPSGVSVDFPGWRPLEASDYAPGGGFYFPGTTTVMTAEQETNNIFNGLILDDSELDYAWRLPTTVTFSVNPTLSFAATYPEATEDCRVARHTEVQITKTASTERTDPGHSFTYALEVENVSEDSAADGVVLTDPIPANLRVTDITWPGQGDASVFPNWSTCEVTGQDAGGYGGTLRCELHGPLQPAGAPAGGAWEAPTITLSVTVNPTSTAKRIVNIAAVEYYTFGDPEDSGRDDDDVPVALGLLSTTGATPMGTLLLLGVLMLLLGSGAFLLDRDRRRRIAM